jgi:hypothetical protein
VKGGKKGETSETCETGENAVVEKIMIRTVFLKRIEFLTGLIGLTGLVDHPRCHTERSE